MSLLPRCISNTDDTSLSLLYPVQQLNYCQLGYVRVSPRTHCPRNYPFCYTFVYRYWVSQHLSPLFILLSRRATFAIWKISLPYSLFTNVSYENALTLHSLQLINLSAFAEHQTRQFPVVGGPRAFAQPNNFYNAVLISLFILARRRGSNYHYWTILYFTLAQNVSGFNKFSFLKTITPKQSIVWSKCFSFGSR